MQIKLFTVSALDPGLQAEEMNTFLRGHKVLEIQSELYGSSSGAYWCFCVKYINAQVWNKEAQKNKERIDYRTVLDETSFARFSKYREIRKSISEEEGVPAYAIFTNEELAEMAKIEVLSRQTMSSIKGIGESV